MGTIALLSSPSRQRSSKSGTGAVIEDEVIIIGDGSTKCKVGNSASRNTSVFGIVHTRVTNVSGCL